MSWRVPGDFLGLSGGLLWRPHTSFSRLGFAMGCPRAAMGIQNSMPDSTRSICLRSASNLAWRFGFAGLLGALWWASLASPWRLFASGIPRGGSRSSLGTFHGGSQSRLGLPAAAPLGRRGTPPQPFVTILSRLGSPMVGFGVLLERPWDVPIVTKGWPPCCGSPRGAVPQHFILFVRGRDPT